MPINTSTSNEKAAKFFFIIFGVSVIISGLIVLSAAVIPTVSMKILWPVFILIPSIMFFIGAFSGGKDSSGMIMPAGMFLTLFAHFQVNVVLDWKFGSMWPNYILCIGVGLLLLFFTDGKRDTIVSAIMFILIAVLFHVWLILEGVSIWAFIFIALGIMILACSLGTKKKKEEPSSDNS